ncbi:tyrosine-protein phosphatase CDC14-like [Bombyx mandarina]|uniref:protein-tyrosine-phosphatase n=1 Tax=Bombyx mandarina TaxID=7092 RepID=A0A6J2JTD6_BOMMA|nr:tyrosine-protein phosphatase CDC14-like [Bombyx mandarina]
MNRNADIIFTAEYVKNVLYFVIVRNGKILRETSDAHYFCIDDELVYENYYSDFGPLNLGCVYKYCKLLNEKLRLCLKKKAVVHYTSAEPKKKTNSAFLIGCYGVLYFGFSPRDALKPLLTHGQTYRQFQDAAQFDSPYTISLMDCMQAIKKARDLGFFNFQDFDCGEYDRLNSIQGGDLNWIVPGKFLAFIGPVDSRLTSFYHPPELYLKYFTENNVKIVIRLNKRSYDGNVFNNAGIAHYDLFFPDGSCPPKHILFKFLQISQESNGAIAVHCKAGLGRTGSLIGSYLIKHYRMTSHEAISWMRICRSGSVIGHQQEWLEQIESWLIKQGNLYRKHKYQDTERLPIHEFGIYSIAERNFRQKPVLLQKSPSPPPPIQRHLRPDIAAPVRPQASKVRDNSDEEDEIFLTSCDLTVTSEIPLTQMKGCIIKSNIIIEDENDNGHLDKWKDFWKNFLCCKPCIQICNDSLWKLSNFLMRSSIFNDHRGRQLSSTVTVTPGCTIRIPTNTAPSYAAHMTPSFFNAASNTTQKGNLTQNRRRLGRSPSPSPTRVLNKQTRATNTPPSPAEKSVEKGSSRLALKEALSRLKLSNPRDGSIGAASVGAASLGARREAPATKRAPSVRSDERHTATQGDMLNSIKFQRRLRETLNTDRIRNVFHEKISAHPSKDRSNIKNS